MVVRTYLKNLGFESYSVAGDPDFVIKNIDNNAENLIDELNRLNILRLMNGINHVAVDEYILHCGYEHDNFHRLDDIPCDAVKLIKLAYNYHSRELSEKEKELFLDSGMLKGYTYFIDTIENNMIHAIIGVQLIGPQEDTDRMNKSFKIYILNKLIQNYTGLQGVYKCHSHRPDVFQFHYLFEIIDYPHWIFDFVFDMHKMAKDIGIKIVPRTFVLKHQLGEGLYKGLDVIC